MAQSTITESAVSLNVNPSAPTGPVLKMVNGVPMVSSREVADHFGKRHADLIRSIAAIIRNAPESFNERNFALVEYVDPKGEKRPSYDMTRDGFVIVAMGFTGKKAIEWKITYIMAFNAMEAQGVTVLTGPLSLAQQQEIKELVDAKVSAYPDNQRRKVYQQVWGRLQKKFKVPRYQELPVSIFHDARDYVISMNVRNVDTPALPAAEPVPALPEANTPEPLPADLGMRLHRMRALKHEMQDISAEIYIAAKRSIRPKFTEYGRPAFSLLVNMNETAQSVLYALDRDLDALEQLCTSGILAGRVFAGSVDN